MLMKLANYSKEDFLQDCKPNFKLLNEVIYATITVISLVTITHKQKCFKWPKWNMKWTEAETEGLIIAAQDQSQSTRIDKENIIKEEKYPYLMKWIRELKRKLWKQDKLKENRR